MPMMVKEELAKTPAGNKAKADQELRGNCQDLEADRVDGADDQETEAHPEWWWFLAFSILLMATKS